MPTFYLNGKFVPEEDAKVSVLDLAKEYFTVEERDISASPAPNTQQIMKIFKDFVRSNSAKEKP